MDTQETPERFVPRAAGISGIALGEEKKAHTVTEDGMSSLLTITDRSTLYVLPSKRFCKVIGSILPGSLDMPAGICKLYAASSNDGQTTKHPTAGIERSTYSKNDIQFTDNELRSINQYLNDQSQRLDSETLGFSNPPYGLDRVHASQASQIRLDLNDLKWLYDRLAQMRGNDDSVPYLHSLLTDCSVALPEFPPQDLSTGRSEAKRAHRLHKEEKDEDIVYQQITRRSIDSARTKTTMPADAIGFPQKYLNRHLLAVARFVFSVWSGFAFGFIGIEFLVGPLDFGFRLLLGVMVGLILALTEIYFLAQTLNEEDDVPSAGHTLQSMPKAKAHQD
ncbi:uncharacterized protein LOC126581226 [Anopheles aquasalis]|uniref:uncharacterized protein LOC126581226 n=1 Tax=Anopheles aquasalis TaxID=42839 RepID=UPI00215AFB7F|nr:uncharacterized protein LOC126581226 [Anopheles aquasalis]